MRRLLKLIGIGTISLFLWAADTTADELADPVEILTDDGKAIGELPAERNYIPFDAPRGDARMGVTTQGDIFVALGDKLCSSSDDGRTWTSRDLSVGAEGFGVIADDVLVLFGGWPSPVTMRSTDLGRTWSEPAPVDISPYEAGGGGWTHISQMRNGPALMTVQLQYRADAIDPDTGQLRTGDQPGLYDHVYRSTDGGRTWGDRSLICRDSAESSVILLQSGKMLAAIRRQRSPQRLLPGDDIEQLKAMDAWRDGNIHLKHGFMADSYDKGYTWENVRLAPTTPDMKHGLCPSDFVQLPDGRVVWIYTRRQMGMDPGVMARVSSDDGKTWSEVRYRVRRMRVDGHVTYATNAVLADGTILSVCGKNHGNRAMAIRWRLPAANGGLSGS
jgi:hypothetical protein